VKRLAVIALAALVLLPACRKKSTAVNSVDAQNKVAVRSIELFFASNDQILVSEKRSLPLPENPAAALPAILRELLKGPATPLALRIFPPDTVVRGAYLLPGGTAIVDLGGPTVAAGWGTGSHQELMALYSVVHTVTANVPDARRVRFLVNGSPAETLAGHISLDRSLVPKPALLVAAAPPPAAPAAPVPPATRPAQPPAPASATAR
jgi:hypothetical protein